MMMQGKDDIAFEKQLNSFEAAMQNDLNHRNTEVAKKWEFDFGMNQPQMGKTMSWTPIENSQTTRPRELPKLKPRMNIGNLLNNKGDSNSSNGSTQVFLNAAGPRTSIFGSSLNTDSTMGDSIFNGSAMNDQIGKSSIGDFNSSMFSSGTGLRTSIAQKIQLQRRKTVLESIPRESEESLNNRGSNINSEEGRINQPQAAILSRSNIPDVNVEEFKASDDEQSLSKSSCSPNSGNESRRLQGVKSIIEPADEEDDPFLPKKSTSAQEASSRQQNSNDDEDECNAEVTEEGGPSNEMPSQTPLFKNKNTKAALNFSQK